MFKFSRLFPTASIGAYLMALVIVVALPLLAFVGFLVLQLEGQEREGLANETAEDAQLIARSVDRELQDMATTLRLLITSPELEAGDLRAFHDRTQRSLRSNSLYVIVVDKDGQQRLNTRSPFGDPLTKMSNMPALESVLRSGITEVSSVFFGKTSNRWVFNVAMPLPDALSHSGSAIIMTQNADDMEKLISIEGLPVGWSAAVIDGQGQVVASGGADKIASGKQFDPDTLRLMTGFKGTIEDVEGDEKQMYGYAQITGWTWKAVVWGPIASAQEGIITTFKQLVAGGVIFLTLAVLFAYTIARQLRTPIRQIADMAERIGKGEIVSPVETRITEANQVAVALSNASFDRSEAEDRIHLILHELVHRTKNILTLVQAMMRQLGRQDTTMPEFQKAISTRLHGLGKSIEALAKEQWAGVRLMRVIEIHLSTFEAGDRLLVSGEDFMLKAEAVQNLGLVLHELATNSVKYGALSVPHGRVRISWDDVAPGDDGEPKIRLVWEESGGPPVTEPSRKGFGTTIIQRHAVAAFGGQVDVEFRPEGLVWRLVAPRANLERDDAGDERRSLAM
ncbi:MULTISPECIES: sensor histidine kinase [Rhizobium]|jgi:two-component sensor histidine kinase|uniref:histidine kinase n=1 Tax=Rhizobium wenxiniae TaxID=1737357 RepID=A0A7W9Y463_9HYPH|nr:sensor histidine kinase [Rhizobium wenxiniae]MBB6161669.1 two-component sensor histidine kinase [Rhizobium wenxiniae]GGF90645.1 sensor histidine kinase [Rhizobium wenxiniae]